MNNTYLSSRILIVTIAALLMFGCSDNDNPTTSVDGITGERMMSLVDTRTLTYLQTDTVITLVPSYTVTASSTTATVTHTLSGDDWIVGDGENSICNFRISNGAVLQNGYWHDVNGTPTRVYFDEPPILLPKHPEVGQSWSGYLPPHGVDTAALIYPFYYSNFGYHFTRQMTGDTTLQLPYGLVDAYRFDVSLFRESWDTSPVATSIEFYADSLGLVRLVFEGSGLKRVQSLIDIN